MALSFIIRNPRKPDNSFSTASNGRLKLDDGSTTSLSSYVQTSGATLEVEEAGADSNSPLTVLGNAQLSGVLQMDFVGGYTPSPGDAFLVVQAGSITAHFDTTPHNMTVDYEPTTVSLTQN